jgi:hypothetical protein
MAAVFWSSRKEFSEMTKMRSLKVLFVSLCIATMLLAAQAPAKAAEGFYDAHHVWRDSVYWHTYHPEWVYRYHPEWAVAHGWWVWDHQYHPEWFASPYWYAHPIWTYGAYDPYHVWRDAEWWHLHNPGWLYSYHPEWVAAYPGWMRADYGAHPEWFRTPYWQAHPYNLGHPVVGYGAVPHTAPYAPHPGPYAEFHGETWHNGHYAAGPAPYSRHEETWHGPAPSAHAAAHAEAHAADHHPY